MAEFHKSGEHANEYSWNWRELLLVASITCAAFCPALQAGFVWDDRANILENVGFRGFSISNFHWMFMTVAGGPYQPLVWLSFACDFFFWGLEPFGYHLINILLHAGNASLLYILSSKLFYKDKLPVDPRARILPPVIAALFFALHPLRVESVVWITERRDVLSGLFFLSTLILYLKYVESGQNCRGRWFVLAIVASNLALLSKGTTIVIPLMLTILDFYPLERLPISRDLLTARYKTIWREKIYFGVPALVVAAIGFLGQRIFGGMPTIESFGIIDRLAISAYGLAFYLDKLLRPMGLSPLYEMPEPFNVLETRFIFSAIFIAGLTVLLICQARRRPALLMLWASFVVAFLPVIGLVKFGQQITADRYSYLPSLSAGIAVGLVALKACRHSRKWFSTGILAGLLFFLAILASLTWRQANVWRDELTLWTHARSATKDHAIASYTLATIMDRQGNADEAIKYYAEAAQLRPRYFRAYIQRAMDLVSAGDSDQAIEFLKAVVVGQPENAVAHNDLGALLAKKGDINLAVAEFQKALRVDAHYENAAKNLESALIIQRRRRQSGQ